MNSESNKTIIRDFRLSDRESVLNIWNEGRLSLKKRGISQWQKGDYPGPPAFISDYGNKSGRVVEIDGETVAVFAFTLSPESSYSTLSGWLTGDKEYLTIHRSAVKESERGKGIFSSIISWCMEEAKRNGKKSIRIDTHEDNISMINALNKNGFKRIGRLTLLSGSESGDYRIGFERIVNFG